MFFNCVSFIDNIVCIAAGRYAVLSPPYRHVHTDKYIHTQAHIHLYMRAYIHIYAGLKQVISVLGTER